MIIENVEALKNWLTITLSPICEADPAALAKYVVALVKKDKPENELNNNLIDQLDVFLQQRTRSFVSGLFEALKTKSYITSSSNGMSGVSVPIPSGSQGAANNYQNSSILNPGNHTATSIPQLPPKGDRKRKIVDGSDAGPSEEDKDYRKKRSRSSSPKGARLSDDRRRRHDDRRFNRRRSRDRSRSKSPRGKSRERHRPMRDSVRDRERSRSPAVRPFGVRSRSRSWSPQRSRSRSRSRGRKEVDSRGSTPLQDSDNYNAVSSASVAPVPPGCSSPVPTVSSVISVVAPWDANRNSAPVPPPPAAANSDATAPPPPPRSTAPPGTGSNRPRCRDYDEKGYCMRGDLCPYDHGLDPVIVEDVNLPNVLSFPHGPPAGPGGPGFVGPRIPPPNHPHLPQMGPRGHPPRPTRPVEPYPPEGYNPESPAINPPRPPFWVGPRGPPPPNQPFYPQPPRQRDLVNVPTIPDVLKPPNLEDKQDENNSCPNNRTVIPPKRDYIPTNDLHKQPNQQQHYPTRSQQQQQQHSNFQPNYQPGHGRPVPRHLNTTLEVRKIPRDQNNIAKLNEHFGKFGVLKNIQVSFENDPEAALITFANHSQANTAYRSSEPVFNNRFIKVFWHREKLPDQNTTTASTTTTSTTSSVSRTSTPQTDHRMPVKARLGIPAPNLLSLDNTLPKKTETAEKAIVFTTSMGHLTKTVFNPAAMKTKINNLTTSTSTTPTTKTISSNSTTFTKTDLVISKKTIPKKDTILKNVQKQRHELLSSYLQQQKILIKKYEDKNNPPETKSKIKEQIENLTTMIKKLQGEIAPKKPELTKPKSSAAAAVTATPNSQKTQKEILDTELELISKQKSGEDTTELRKKLIELTQEAAALGLLPRGRGSRGMIRGGMRIRGNSWSRGLGRGRMLTSCRSLDNRPKQIHVSGFESDQYKNIIAHFALFCEVVKSEPDATETSVILTFKSRQDAEKAVTKCSRYKDKDLKIQWYIPGSTIITDTTTLELEDSEVLPNSPSYLPDLDDSLLAAADDEDEEDEESRSWRR